MLAAAGEIKNMTISWLFQEIRTAEKSGTAVFEQDKLIKKVYFSKGDVLSASSDIEDDRLGEFLFRQGRITRAQFDASSEIVLKTKKKLGAVLFEMDILSPKELVALVRLQIKQIILSLFNWQEGRYRFDEGNLSDPEIIPLQMSAGNLILEGIQALDWQIIRKSIPPMQTLLRPSPDPSLLFQNADLSADQAAVLTLIDGTRTIEQICSLSDIGDFNTLKAVYLLLALKMAEVGGIKSEKEKAFVRASAAKGAVGQKKHEPSGPEPAATRRMIEQAFEAMKGQDDFQVLGVNNTITAADLKKVYFRLAKRYHPDRHFEPEMADMKEKLEALFSRIHDAYERIANQDQSPNTPLSPAETSVHSGFEQKRSEEYVENYAEKTTRAAAYFQRGVKEFKDGNFWGAADSFAWATRLDPVKAAYFYHYGMALMRMPRRLHEAEESFQKAIEIEPLNPQYHIELGGLYLKSGLKTKAVEIFAAALKSIPDSSALKEALKTAGEDVPRG